MIRRIKRIKPKKRFTPVKVVDPVKTGDEREFLFLPPPEPRRKLLVWTSVVFGVWVVCLLVMYFTTVYPERHGSHHVTPASQPTVPTTEPIAVPVKPTTNA